MFVQKDVLDKIGGFDEQFDPTCFEDTDISFAIRNLGLKIFYSPYLGVYHLPHQTTHGGDIDHDTIIEKHRSLFTKKWKKINPDLFREDFD